MITDIPKYVNLACGATVAVRVPIATPERKEKREICDPMERAAHEPREMGRMVSEVTPSFPVKAPPSPAVAPHSPTDEGPIRHLDI